MKRLFLVLALLAACTSTPGLISGQTAAEVEARLGAPAEKRLVGGETVYYYPQLPWGHASYAARFGADGRLVAYEQRLTEENIRKLERGRTTIGEVRDLLGPPYQPQTFARMDREIWTYPMRILAEPTPKWFLAQFSGDGVLRETTLIDDPNFVAKDTPRQHR